MTNVLVRQYRVNPIPIDDVRGVSARLLWNVSLHAVRPALVSEKQKRIRNFDRRRRAAHYTYDVAARVGFRETNPKECTCMPSTCRRRSFSIDELFSMFVFDVCDICLHARIEPSLFRHHITVDVD